MELIRLFNGLTISTSAGFLTGIAINLDMSNVLLMMNSTCYYLRKLKILEFVVTPHQSE